MTDTPHCFEVRNLRKAFGGAVALDDVSLDVRPGEIHALLGHNGAGKSTLIKCIGGGLTPDAGKVIIDGVARQNLTPTTAIHEGIAVIYQNLALVPSLTVTDNIFLGNELKVGGVFTRRRAQARIAAELLERFGARFSASAKVDSLSVAEQQIVAISKALHRNASLLVLDEPTAALSEPEARMLADRLRGLRSQGLSILYVTHLLKEVFELSDRVTVLRDGRVVMSAKTSATSRDELISAIAGRARAEYASGPRTVGRSLLAADHLTGPRFGPVSFQLHAGEVVAIYGLLGSGRTEVLEAIFGRQMVNVAGTVRMPGFAGLFRHPSAAIQHGIALVPAERIRQGLLMPMSCRDNALLPSFSRLASAGMRRYSREASVYATAAASIGILPPAPRASVSSLSGGNQQKVMLARWLNGAQKAEVLLLDEPTQGIDVGVRGELYALLREAVSKGDRTVLITSSDPEEVVAVADRALILVRGRIVHELSRGELSEASLIAAGHL